MLALSIVDRQSRYGANTGVINKGSSDKYFVNFCLQVLSELGFTDLILQVYGKHSITYIAKAIANKRTGSVQLRDTPKGSSASNGAVERFHQSTQSMARTLVAQVELNYDIKLSRGSVIKDWLLRHASFLNVMFKA